MFLRFSIFERDVHCHHMAGVFSAAYRLRDSGYLPEYEYDHLQDLLTWFGIHLPRPHRFTVDGVGGEAICWFRVSARECISRAWEVVTFLDRYNVRVFRTRTTRPGYVAYEDEFQVAAIPFRDTWH